MPVRAGTNIPDIAVDPNSGRVYVVWADGRFSGGAYPDVLLSSSIDGRRWTTPVKVNQTPVPVAAFNPTVEVSADGTVGVLYYDFREQHRRPRGSRPRCSWPTRTTPESPGTSKSSLGGPFDMENAPFARGLFLGDYQGLVAIPTDAVADRLPRLLRT